MLGVDLDGDGELELTLIISVIDNILVVSANEARNIDLIGSREKILYKIAVDKNEHKNNEYQHGYNARAKSKLALFLPLPSACILDFYILSLNALRGYIGFKRRSLGKLFSELLQV